MSRLMNILWSPAIRVWGSRKGSILDSADHSNLLSNERNLNSTPPRSSICRLKSTRKYTLNYTVFSTINTANRV